MFEADTVMIDARKVRPKREEMRERRVAVCRRKYLTIEPVAGISSPMMAFMADTTLTSPTVHVCRQPKAFCVRQGVARVVVVEEGMSVWTSCNLS